MIQLSTLVLDMAINTANKEETVLAAELAGLLREDGEPRYSPAEDREHRARIAERRAELVATVQAERAALTSAWAAQEAGLRARMAAEAGDVASWFAGTERAELGERLPIVAAQIDGLGDDALIAQLEAVAAGASPLERATWWLAAGRRLREAREAAEKDQPNEVARAFDTGRMPAGGGAGNATLGRLGDAMRRLREAAMPTAVSKRIAELEADLAAFGPARVDMYGKRAQLEIDRQAADVKRRVASLL